MTTTIRTPNAGRGAATWAQAQARIAIPGAATLQNWRLAHGPEHIKHSRVAQAAQASARAPSRRQYGGAAFGRTTADWIANGTSADSELITSLRPLRNRSRQLCRDNEYAKNAKRTVMINVVGRGIRLQSLVKKRRGDQYDDKINTAIEASWRHWIKAKRCHTAGKLSWARLQQVIIQTVFESGECLVRLVRKRFGDSRVALALEIIEADQIVDTWNGRTGVNGNEIRMGVEVDEWQRPVAYWLYPRHPGDNLASATVPTSNYIRVPADEIIHVCLLDRPYQTRGVPWMHATLVKLRHMGGYEEAEIVAARASAAIMGFRQRPELDMPGEDDDGGADDIVDGERVTDMEPGIIMDLGPGETFTGFNPSRPNAALDPFMRFMLRSVAAGIGVSYESLSRDYSQSNYSSSRLSLLEDRELWRVLQDWLIETLCEPVFAAWLEMAVLGGELNLPAYETQPHIYEAVRWAPRGWKWVDPAKEGAAAKSDVRSGFTTLTDVLAEQGEDLEEHFQRRADELKLAKQYGLVLDTDPSQLTDKGSSQASAQAGQGAAKPGEPDEDDKPGGEGEEGAKKPAAVEE
ncbi:phage portal protein [Ideonella paludis]|uniref:Phage portal protein n=1 Tax=Ideonella paludis TaxID=1233411 RepID=A0ABS5DU22_9BURK|nr:phage portal protein [Ideonella paludis]MBQ0934642.1 phage portal protein [Ideonella paludis]